jgi:hypothetical protein
VFSSWVLQGIEKDIKISEEVNYKGDPVVNISGTYIYRDQPSVTRLAVLMCVRPDLFDITEVNKHGNDYYDLKFSNIDACIKICPEFKKCESIDAAVTAARKDKLIRAVSRVAESLVVGQKYVYSENGSTEETAKLFPPFIVDYVRAQAHTQEIIGHIDRLNMSLLALERPESLGNLEKLTAEVLESVERKREVILKFKELADQTHVLLQEHLQQYPETSDDPMGLVAYALKRLEDIDLVIELSISPNGYIKSIGELALELQ